MRFCLVVCTCCSFALAASVCRALRALFVLLLKLLVCMCAFDDSLLNALLHCFVIPLLWGGGISSPAACSLVSWQRPDAHAQRHMVRHPQGQDTHLKIKISTQMRAQISDARNCRTIMTFEFSWEKHFYIEKYRQFCIEIYKYTFGYEVDSERWAKKTASPWEDPWRQKTPRILLRGQGAQECHLLRKVCDQPPPPPPSHNAAFSPLEAYFFF
jgi:hypothetical protein